MHGHPLVQGHFGLPHIVHGVSCIECCMQLVYVLYMYIHLMLEIPSTAQQWCRFPTGRMVSAFKKTNKIMTRFL